MKTYISILTVFYYIFTAVFTVMFGICFVKSRKLSGKIVSALGVLMFVLRLFQIY